MCNQGNSRMFHLILLGRFIELVASQDVCGTLRWTSSCPTEQYIETIQTNLKSQTNVQLRAATNDVDNARKQRDQIFQNLENHKKISEDFLKLVKMRVAAEETTSNIALMDIESSKLVDGLATKLRNAEENSKSLESLCMKNSYRKTYSKDDKKVMLLTGSDCADIHGKGGRKSGFYYIQPEGAAKLIKVHCDMKDSGGGWTVIQRRYNGHLNFDRDWDSYKWGFRYDDAKHWEYWIGNEYIHLLTRQKLTELKITLTPWAGSERYAYYRYFSVADESNNYNLREINGYLADSNGDVGDAMEIGSVNRCRHGSIPAGHVRMDFTTKDRDNDRFERNCAGNGRGGWWFNQCLSANLNGIRKRQGQVSNSTQDGDGILWTTWKGCHKSLRGSTMKVRPSSFRPDRTPILPKRQDILRRQMNNGLKITRRLSRRWRRSAQRSGMRSRRFR